MYPKTKIELAHHAVANLATGKISVPIGDVTLNMDYDSFLRFVTEMQEVALSFSASMEIQSYACETCGSINDVIQEKEHE